MTAPDGWVQIIRGPHPLAEDGARGISLETTVVTLNSGHSRRSRSASFEREPSEGQTSSSRTSHQCFVESEAFVERARKRLQAHDAARQQVVQEGGCSDTDTVTQVQLLQPRVNKLQEEKDCLSNCMGPWSDPGSGSACPRRIFARLSRPCRR